MICENEYREFPAATSLYGEGIVRSSSMKLKPQPSFSLLTACQGNKRCTFFFFQGTQRLGLYRFAISVYDAASQYARTDANGNVVVSPIGLSVVSAMCLVGSAGSTAQQLREVLHLGYVSDRTAVRAISSLVHRIKVRDTHHLPVEVSSTLLGRGREGSNINFLSRWSSCKMAISQHDMTRFDYVSKEIQIY